jgi:hypothetical protein
MKHLRLAAFSAERRIAAVALFNGSQLEDVRLRHIQPDLSKASGSVREIVTRTIEEESPGFIAISAPSPKAGPRIRVLCNLVSSIASEFGIPVVEVDAATLQFAYGHPPLIRKEHVRAVGRAIWPSLADAKSKRALLDAATTGLHVQTERLFSQYEQTT